jgi:ElaB/YqjD/DUF883 family membrane-anchored ribosome-binding protein
MPVETDYSSSPASGSGSDQRTVGNPGGSIQSAMEASRNRLASAYSTVQQRSNAVLHDAEGFIQDRPFQAVIYAASIGAVIGLVAGLILGGDRSESGRRWW